MLSRFRYILLSGIVLIISLRAVGQLAMPDNVCIGAAKHYFVDPNPVPGSTYTWRINGVTQVSSTTNEIDITWNTTGTYLLEVQELSIDGCPGPLRSGQVFVSPLPTLVAGLTVQPSCTVPTGSVVLSGLPAGNWTINPGAISGTGSSKIISGLAAGTYNYTVTNADGCTSVASADVVINAQPSTPTAPTVSTSTPGNVCPAETINLTTLVTSVTPTGGSILYKTTNNPLGIDVIDPTIVGTGSYYIFYQNQEGCFSTGTFVTGTVNPCPKTLNLTSVMLEGLYDGGGTMRQAWNAFGPQWPAGVADHITVELHDAASYATIVYTATDVPLSTNGTATVTVPAIYSGSYYITIKHRNSVETTTASVVSFAGNTINQSFGAPAKVYGGNLGVSLDGYYLIYGGDVNQDGIVDTGDMNEVDNGSTAILIGYNAADVNGDGIVDTSDMNTVDNNSTAIVMVKLPY
jgi:hypothetical protein